MVRQTLRFLALLAPCVAVALLPMTSAEEPASDAPRTLPPGRLGEVVALGRQLVSDTSGHPLSAPYVGNDLNCTSCHLDNGEHPTAGSFLGVATAYPAWSPREEHVITLEDRVLNCFMRSENGVRPPHGGEVSIAITAYITWLSEGHALRMNSQQPLGPNAVKPIELDPATADVERGAGLYEENCSACHGSDGVGSDDGPPVWGDRSYNRGAGLSQNAKLASWLKVAMPLGDPILSDQEALDIAAYVNSHERPGFVLKDHLGPLKPPANP